MGTRHGLAARIARPAADWKVGCQSAVRLDPADVSVLSAVNHVELARRRILEHQRVGVAQVHQHHRVGHAGLGNVDPRFGDDRRIGRGSSLVLGRRAAKTV